MDIHYPTIEEPATPDYILTVLQDMHRQQCRYDPEADADAVLSLDTTVAEWRMVCDLAEWQELGQAYNDLWCIACSDAEWRETLEPADTRRLADVCELIARHAFRPEIRPARLLRSNCIDAGAFLTIRSLLHDAGAPAAQIKPSTPLAPYTRQYTDVFLGPVSRLAPGSLPMARIRTPVYDGAVYGLLGAAICLIGGGLSGCHPLAAVGAVLWPASYALTWYAARCLGPASVEFGELRTFRDLATVIAASRQN